MFAALRRFVSETGDVLALAVNVAFVLVFVYASLTGFAWARACLANAGGWPELSLLYAQRLVLSEGLHLRLFWWMSAWALAIMSMGCAWLALLGSRSVAWRTLALLRGL